MNEYEFNDIVTLDNVLNVIQRAEMTMRMAEEVKKRIIELGEEGRLVQIQLDELIGGLEKEEELLIKDYIAPSKKRTLDKVIKEIIEIEYEELMNEQREEELNNAAKLIEDTLINVSEISSSVIQKVEESIENVLPKKNTYRPVYAVFALIRDELGIF